MTMKPLFSFLISFSILLLGISYNNNPQPEEGKREWDLLSREAYSEAGGNSFPCFHSRAAEGAEVILS